VVSIYENRLVMSVNSANRSTTEHKSMQLKHKCQTNLHRNISVRHQVTKTGQFVYIHTYIHKTLLK